MPRLRSERLMVRVLRLLEKSPLKLPAPRGLLPTIERMMRWTAAKNGLRTRIIPTKLSPVSVYDGAGGGHMPPVVVLHGIGANATSFVPTMLVLKKCVRRVFAPDLPMHGFSPMPDRLVNLDEVYEALTEVLNQTFSEPVILFGNSLGGGLAMRYALDFPERVRGLVLASPAGAPFPPGELQRFLNVFRLKDREDVSRLLDKLYVRKPRWTRYLHKDILRDWSRVEMQALLASINDDHTLNAEDLSRLKMPMLLMWGDHETLMPEDHLSFFKENLPPQAKLERPHGFSHCPNLEEPVRLAQRIACFAQEVMAQTPLNLHDP